MFNVFKLEAERKITDYDIELINAFYLPLVGASAATLYSFLHSKLKENNYNCETVVDKVELFSSLGIKETRFEKSKQFLEAVGLVRTFFSNFYNDTIISLKKPMELETILKNKLLCGKIEKKIGKTPFEKLKSKFTIKTNNKDEYEDQSAKFLDIFPIEEQNNHFNTSEISLLDIQQKDQAQKVYDTETYIRFLTKAEPKPSLVNKINSFSEIFDQQALNEIIFYCHEVDKTKAINPRYFETIAKDLEKKNIKDATDIKSELQEVLSYKRAKKVDVLKKTKIESTGQTSIFDTESFDEEPAKTVDLENLFKLLDNGHDN
ncbi:DnaD domain protein [Mycoplasma procyoni]|uniref:DnaD domain protein n=1 Tax=Mycoplasma procyoni TaxID=568784 RepID=UPI00197BC184|nr:DnaD domain protein [Mycoplasma procyoni]MBN3534617.1 DnaD domain protein [Mycoplasma procyoni]